MKRIFAWGLAVAVLMSLAGCKGVSDAGTGGLESTVSTVSVAAVSEEGALTGEELTGDLPDPVEEPPYAVESEAYEPDEEVTVSHSTVSDGSDPWEPESTAHLFEGYVPMEKNPAQLDEATEAEIIAAYSEKVGYPVEEISIAEYYNTYDGVVAITFMIMNPNHSYPAVAILEKIGDYAIGYGAIDLPYLYRDGELKDFHDAYDAGWLSDAATKDLAYYYKF